MSNLENLAVVILTYNKEVHIERCIKSAKKLTKNIYVVDSFSNDNTVQIAEKNKVNIQQNIWPGTHSKQLKWFLSKNEHLEWVLRLDADETLPDKICAEIRLFLSNSNNTYAGMILKRKHVFLNKILSFGPFPAKILRLWNTQKCFISDDRMDEKIINHTGETVVSKSYFYDNNLKSYSEWLLKHLQYAEKEAQQQIVDQKIEQGFERLYYNFPLFLRCFLLFFVRYFFQFGFLDGMRGFLFHFSHSLVYRLLVDLHILHLKLNK